MTADRDAAAQFWHGVYPEGWTKERVENEMSDYRMVLDGLAGLYDHITGGRASKENTDKAVIRELYEDHVNEMISDAVKEATEEQASEIAALRRRVAQTRQETIVAVAKIAQEWSGNWRQGDAVPRESASDGDGWYRSTISTAEARARVLDAFVSHITALSPSPPAEEREIDD